jgi:tetratricopeptide (TPR) repeat protein
MTKTAVKRFLRRTRSVRESGSQRMTNEKQQKKDFNSITDENDETTTSTITNGFKNTEKITTMHCLLTTSKLDLIEETEVLHIGSIDNDSIWNDVTNASSTIHLSSSSHSTAFMDNVTPTSNKSTPIAAVSNNGAVSATASEEYWHKRVVPNFPPEHRDLLAESLFCHIWKSQGRSVALKLLGDHDHENLIKTAEDRFNHGCQLWRQDDHQRARWELERSRKIREVQMDHSLVHVRYQESSSSDVDSDGDDYDDENNENENDCNQGNRNWEDNKLLKSSLKNGKSFERKNLARLSCRKPTSDSDRDNIIHRVNILKPTPTESNAQLYYAMGTVLMAQQEYQAGLKEFRRAAQIASLGLDFDHELSKASYYMIRTTLLTMGYSSHSIRKYIAQMKTDITNEITGDVLCEIKDWDEALLEYANLSFLHDKDGQTQARIRTKIATIFEERGDYSKAMELWSDVLVLYDNSQSIGLDHPLAKHTITKIVKARRKIQASEI